MTFKFIICYKYLQYILYTYTSHVSLSFHQVSVFTVRTEEVFDHFWIELLVS